MPQKHPPATTTVSWPFCETRVSSTAGPGITVAALVELWRVHTKSANTTNNTIKIGLIECFIAVSPLIKSRGNSRLHHNSLRCFGKSHCHRIHAVTQTGWIRPVVEHVP